MSVLWWRLWAVRHQSESDVDSLQRDVQAWREANEALRVALEEARSSESDPRLWERVHHARIMVERRRSLMYDLAESRLDDVFRLERKRWVG